VNPLGFLIDQRLAAACRADGLVLVPDTLRGGARVKTLLARTDSGERVYRIV